MHSLVVRVCLVVLSLPGLADCAAASTVHDASGVFEARESVISAEVAGQILEMPIVEGQQLTSGSIAAKLDCKQLELQRAQALASEAAVSDRLAEARPQLEVLRAQQQAMQTQLAVQQRQLDVLERERRRILALVSAQAAPSKQLTDIEGQIAVLQEQTSTTRSQVAVIKQQAAAYADQVKLQNRATTSEREPLQALTSLYEEQIRKCQVVNPLTGTVLTKYAEQFEFATPGKPLYRIADLRTMTLRAYVTADQLGSLKLGQSARVFVDAGRAAFRELPGTLIWVSDTAEFTPKTIQTKDERANLVYATKLQVPNDGSLKIGMYGEVSF